ncbi:MAG: hypothetical protein ACOC56_06400 [Atribacterota bacterium]
MIRIKANKFLNKDYKKVYKVERVSGALKLKDLPEVYFSEPPYCYDLPSSKPCGLKTIAVKLTPYMYKRLPDLLHTTYASNWSLNWSTGFIKEGNRYYPKELEYLISVVRECADKLEKINEWNGFMCWEI